MNNSILNLSIIFIVVVCILCIIDYILVYIKTISESTEICFDFSYLKPVERKTIIGKLFKIINIDDLADKITIIPKNSFINLCKTLLLLIALLIYIYSFPIVFVLALIIKIISLLVKRLMSILILAARTLCRFYFIK